MTIITLINSFEHDHAFSVSHVERHMDLPLKRETNPFHSLMSLRMIYSMSNYKMYYHPITDDVELCHRTPHVGTHGGIGQRAKKKISL